MEDLVQLVIKTYGVAGVIMLSPFAGLIFLWRHYVKSVDKHHVIVETLQKAKDDLNQKRIDDAKAITEKLLLLVAEQGSLNKETSMALDKVGDMLSIVSTTKR